MTNIETTVNKTFFFYKNLLRKQSQIGCRKVYAVYNFGQKKDPEKIKTSSVDIQIFKWRFGRDLNLIDNLNK